MTTNPPLDQNVIDYNLDPEPHSPPAGDWKDDDGQAIDSYFEAADLGPLAYKLVQAMSGYINPPKQASRIVRNRLNMQSTNVVTHAVMAFPADPDRSYLSITDVTGKGFYYHSESFTVTDDPTIPPAQTPAAFIPPNALPTRVEIANYTGPIWVAGSFANGAILEIVAVTA